MNDNVVHVNEQQRKSSHMYSHVHNEYYRSISLFTSNIFTCCSLVFFLGQYYNYDSSVSLHHDSIMSDQLAGFWYLRLCGHHYEVRIDSVLKTIFEMNVMQFGNGKLGAVNGMTKTGQVEIVSMQSEEIWTGVNYGLSSTMIMEVRNLTHQYSTCADQ
jgi:uncharacterized protein (DUF608 family)